MAQTRIPEPNRECRRRDSNNTHSTLVLDGIAGALWHTIQHEAIAGKIELLPTFRNYLTFILTAPFLGAKPAAALLAERSE
jgi:hypothetical protein